MEKAETTAQIVKEEINSSVFILESLKKGIINYSELARQLLPKIKKMNNKANFASVLIAIQRYYDEVKEKTEYSDKFREILKDSELIMKTNIVDLTFERTREVMKEVNEIAKTIRWDMGDIMFIIQGTGEVTIIIDKKNLKKFEKIKNRIIEKKEDLALLSLREPEEITSYSRGLVGFFALLSTLLADKDINIWEAATTYKQNIFIIYESDLPKAYETLSKLIEFYKNVST
jgi:hypothetical protein